MRLKSKLGNLALEDFADPEVTDKADPTAGVDNPDETETSGEPEAAAAEPAAAEPAAAEAEPAPGAAGDTPAPAAGDNPEAVAETSTDIAGGADPAADQPTPAVSTDPEAPAADAAVAAADNTGEPAAAVDETVVVDAEAEEVEADMTAVDDIADKEEEVSEDVENLVDATESLEKTVAALECAIERGGLDFAGSVLARNNVDTVTRFLKVKSLPIPALEDMEDPSAKIEAAGNLKDTIVAFIKRIIDTIKDGAKRFGEWVVQTYQRLTNAYSALEARAAKLAEKVKASTMVEGKIDNAKVGYQLGLDGKIVDNLQAYLTNLSQFTKFMNDPATYKGYLESIDLCETMLKDPTKAEQVRGEISTKLSQWADGMEKFATNNAKAMHGAPSKGDTGTAGFTVNVLGNQVLTVTIPATADGIGSLKSELVDNGNNNVTGDLVALNQAEAGKICELVANLAKQARESAAENKGGVKQITADIKQRNETITAMMTALQAKVSEGEEASVIRKVVLYVSNFLASSPKLPVHAINRTLPRDLTAALNYVAASIGGAAVDGPAKQLGKNGDAAALPNSPSPKL